MDPLPIDDSLPCLLAELGRARRVILSAPPGAGKTTRVPLALLEAPWMAGKKLLMLEPRRLAARRAASYMAAQLGESVGETVGFRIRGEAVSGRNTRIEVVTEGILTRLLHSGPDLPGVALVVFDEFHERSIHADLGLALALDVQDHLREDLRLLVMSATLDGVSLARVLGDVPVVVSAGGSHPVETRYLSYPWKGSVEREAVRVIRRALGETTGDLLVFLPGVREIRRAEMMLQEGELPGGAVAYTLFGDADPQSQSDALGPPPQGKRKILLSTSIAETSLTIDGIRVVVDSGLSRVPRFDPRRGMTGLVTVPASIASADQRRGRAGRQAPGACYRLWTEEQHRSLPAFSSPEILEADLAPLALDIARWGGGDGLRFIDPPPPSHLSQARSILKSLGALDSRGALTSHGSAMADLPVHPRLAHMILRGKDLSLGSLSCDLGALLEERDILRGAAGRDVDIASRVQALHEPAGAGHAVRARLQAESRRLRRLLGEGAAGRGEDLSRLGLLVAFAYPERVARRRGESPGRYLMVNGAGAVLPEGSVLGREEFLAVADVDGIATEVRVFLAAPLEREELVEAFRESILEQEEVFWNQEDEAVTARQVRRLGAITVEERVVVPRGETVREAMMEGIRLMGLEVLPWGRESVRSRSEWLRLRGLAPSDWPDLSDATLLATLRTWLGPFLGGMARRSHLQNLDMVSILRSLFAPRQWNDLARLAPETITVPTGSRVRLDYAAGEIPVLSVRLQEMFGQTDTPRIAGGRAGVLIHLLSPAGRPLAVTQDLRSFWSNAYQDVRKEMRGRYPRHIWPEDPLGAKPTKKTRRSARRD